MDANTRGEDEDIRDEIRCIIDLNRDFLDSLGASIHSAFEGLYQLKSHDSPMSRCAASLVRIQLWFYADSYVGTLGPFGQDYTVLDALTQYASNPGTYYPHRFSQLFHDSYTTKIIPLCSLLSMKDTFPMMAPFDEVDGVSEMLSVKLLGSLLGAYSTRLPIVHVGNITDPMLRRDIVTHRFNAKERLELALLESDSIACDSKWSIDGIGLMRAMNSDQVYEMVCKEIPTIRTIGRFRFELGVTSPSHVASFCLRTQFLREELTTRALHVNLVRAFPARASDIIRSIIRRSHMHSHVIACPSPLGMLLGTDKFTARRCLFTMLMLRHIKKRRPELPQLSVDLRYQVFSRVRFTYQANILHARGVMFDAIALAVLPDFAQL